MPAQRMGAPITNREAVLAIQKRDYLLPAINVNSSEAQKRLKRCSIPLCVVVAEVSNKIRCVSCWIYLCHMPRQYLQKSYDFTVGFLCKKSTNTCFFSSHLLFKAPD